MIVLLELKNAYFNLAGSCKPGTWGQGCYFLMEIMENLSEEVTVRLRLDGWRKHQQEQSQGRRESKCKGYKAGMQCTVAGEGRSRESSDQAKSRSTREENVCVCGGVVVQMVRTKKMKGSLATPPCQALSRV